MLFFIYAYISLHLLKGDSFFFECFPTLYLWRGKASERKLSETDFSKNMLFIVNIEEP